MSEIKAKLKSAVVEAMKAKDQLRLTALRTISSAIKQKEIDDRVDLADLDVIAILQKQLKQAEESLEQALQAKRAELIAEAEKTVAIVKEFLPAAMSPQELLDAVKKIVTELRAKGGLPEGAKAMGAVMGSVRAVVAGRADGKSIQEAVKAALGN